MGTICRRTTENLVHREGMGQGIEKLKGKDTFTHGVCSIAAMFWGNTPDSLTPCKDVCEWSL